MTTEQFTVSLRSEDLAELRRMVAAGDLPSVGRFVREAVAWSLRAESEWIRTLDEMLDETGGPLTDEEVEQAERELGLPHRRTPRVA